MTPDNRLAVEIMHFDYSMSPYAILLDFKHKGVDLELSDIECAIDSAIKNREDGIYTSAGGNRIINYCGESLTVGEWSQLLNISAKTLHNRIQMGWNSSRIIQTPVKETGRRVHTHERKYKPYARRKAKPAIRQSPGPQARAGTET